MQVCSAAYAAIRSLVALVSRGLRHSRLLALAPRGQDLFETFELPEICLGRYLTRSVRTFRWSGVANATVSAMAAVMKITVVEERMVRMMTTMTTVLVAVAVIIVMAVAGSLAMVMVAVMLMSLAAMV